MQRVNTDLSRDALVNFLNFAGGKGLIKKDTAVSYRNASGIILAILDDSEAADLSRIDLEDVIARHRNIAAGKIPPATLQSYESRLRTAVKNFLEYSRNPSSWKPDIKQRAARATAAKPTNIPEPLEPKRIVEEAGGFQSQPSVHIDLQIHISPEARPEQIDQIFASMRRHLYNQ